MSDERLEQLDYYTLLGVPRTATIDEIKRAFRTFARKFHPDRFAGAPADKVERATRIYRRGSEAVQTLTDLESRRAYDIGLGKGELRLRDDPRAVRAVAPAAAAGAARRDETGAQSQTTLRSPSARAFFAKAQEAARAGDLQTAWKAIKAAMEQEPGSPILETALSKIEAQLRMRR